MHQEPEIYSPDVHDIHPERINSNALKVLTRLHEAGFRACLVGGGVRDLMLGLQPKDFDIATDATPEEVRDLFRNARLIGRRFRLAHVRFGRDIIEVATFRAPHEEADHHTEALVEASGRILRDNVYGSLEQDVWRRDFTVNSLYFDIADASVIDYTGGVSDLKERVLRLIGHPEQRYREDPVRMLRAVRFAAKLGFSIDSESERIIHELAPLIADTPPARLFEEFIKLMHSGAALRAFELLQHFGLFSHIAPATSAALAGPSGEFLSAFLRKTLENTDARVNEGKPVNPAFLIAVMLWGPLQDALQHWMDEEGLPPFVALSKAGSEVIAAQQPTMVVPRRFATQAREIWELQRRLERATGGKRPFRLREHDRFRAAYDFLCLRAQSGETELESLCQWWTKFQEDNPLEAKPATRDDSNRRSRRPRRRKPRKSV